MVGCRAIRDDEAFQFVENPLEVVEHVVVGGSEHEEVESFHEVVALLVVIHLVVMGGAVNLDHHAKRAGVEVGDIVADDKLPVEVDAEEHFLVHMCPEDHLGEVARFAVLAGVIFQVRVLRKLREFPFRDDDVVDDVMHSCCFTTPAYGHVGVVCPAGRIVSLFTTPAFGHPF